MSLNFDQIQPLTGELAALEVAALKGKSYEGRSGVFIYTIS